MSPSERPVPAGALPAVPPARSGPARRPLSLRTRLVAVLVVLLALGSVIIGGVTHTAMSAQLMAQAQQSLDSAFSRALAEARTPAIGGGIFITFQGMPPGAVVGVIEPGHDTIARRYDPQEGAVVTLLGDDLTTIDALATVPTGRQAVVRSIDGTDVAFRAGPVARTSSKTLVVGVPLTEMQHTLRTLDLTMVLVSLAGVVLVGLLGTMLVSRALRPLGRVSAVASSVADQPLDEGQVDVAVRVDVRDAVPGTEVGNVGSALNKLLDNVDGALTVRARSEAQMRRFAADASHELRTPLAAIQGYSELIGATEALSDDGERSLGRVREQTKRMTELVENLLLLARLDEGKAPRSAPVDLTRLGAEASADFSVAAPEHSWRFETRATSPVVVLGDESQLNRVLQNLLSNARKHTSAGTSVTLSVGLDPAGTSAVVTVHDDGEGIDAAFADKVFDRFARADAARSGSAPTTGLGLSIVRAIVEAHGGTIAVKSTPGNTEFVVTLPLEGGQASAEGEARPA